jgi:hypothetical protein
MSDRVLVVHGYSPDGWKRFKPDGTVSSEEYATAEREFVRRTRANPGALGYWELADLLGHEPTTWEMI